MAKHIQTIIDNFTYRKLWYICGKLNITNATFTENSAEKAGALYLLDTGNITDSKFNSNNAERGLAIIKQHDN